MTGLQLASFWEGNRAQLFATHVLSSVAAVVPVPVPMDFGHDLLCLLTRRKDNALYAGRAFGVQVKSGSIREIRYGGLNDKQTWKKYELDWLYDQHQPLITVTASRSSDTPCSESINANKSDNVTSNISQMRTRVTLARPRSILP